MAILFYYPQKQVINLFKNDKRIIFMDNYGFYKFKNGIKRKILLNEPNFNHFKKSNFPNLIKKISTWIPVWSRFNDEGHFYYHNFRKVLYNYLKIHTFFKNTNIKKVVMFTYASHNIRSLLVDLVCSENKVKQLFFYDSGMIPGKKEQMITGIVQKFNFKKRDFINFKISNNKIDKDLYNFKKDSLEKLEKNFFVYKPYFFSHFFSYNFYFSFFYTFIFYLTQNFKLKLNKIFKDDLFIDIHKYSTLNHLQILYNQKKAITFYKNNKINSIDFFKNKKKKIIIAASIQPEASSFPESADWNHMFEIFLEIKRLGFKDKIFYKEHPVMNIYTDAITKHARKGISRNVEYYQYLKNLDCYFLDENINLLSKNIINNSIIFSMGSTVNLERSLLGYKSVYFGNPWWKGAPGTYHISELKNLSNINYLYGHDKNLEKNTIKFLKKKLNYKLFNNEVGMHALPNELKNHKSIKSSINKLIAKF
jgi:hypothetical protein